MAKCKRCKQRAGQPSLKGICRHCWDEEKKQGADAKRKELDAGKLARARSSEDFRKLADEMKDVLVAAARGDVKITSAQAAILRTVFDRGYGRPTASQESKAAASGVVILPALGSDANMQICPRCGYVKENAKDQVAAESGTADSVSGIDGA